MILESVVVRSWPKPSLEYIMCVSPGDPSKSSPNPATSSGQWEPGTEKPRPQKLFPVRKQSAFDLVFQSLNLVLLRTFVV